MDTPSITPHEVRAVARAPIRTHIGLCGVGSLAIGALLLLGRGPAPEPGVERLPPELRRLPDATEYAQWRLFDVITRLERSSDPAEIARARVDASLAAIDGWQPVAPAAVPADRSANLLAIGAERDWHAPPPVLPDVDLVVRREATAIVERTSQAYDTERRALLTETWTRQAAEDAAAVLEWQAEGWVGAGLLGLGAVLLVAWTGLGPREVVVGLHQVRFGHREVPWSDVVAWDWSAGWVRTRNGAWDLGPRAFADDAAAALEGASQQARARAETLAPRDDRALRALEDLRR